MEVTASTKLPTICLSSRPASAISISGSFTAEVYAKDGSEPRVSFRIIVDRIASPPPGKPKQRAGREVDQPRPFEAKRWERGPDDGVIPF